MPILFAQSSEAPAAGYKIVPDAPTRYLWPSRSTIFYPEKLKSIDNTKLKAMTLLYYQLPIIPVLLFCPVDLIVPDRM